MASVLTRSIRKIFVGDVHGCYDELMTLLVKLKHNHKQDELYFVGDLVAKGPRNNDVISFIRNTPNTYSVMGNHDYKVIKCAQDINKYPQNIKYPNLDDTQLHYSSDHIKAVNELTLNNIEYLAQLPLYLRPHPKIIVVHAGLIPHIPLQEQSPFLLMNLRNIIIDNQHDVTNKVGMKGISGRDYGERWASFWKGPQHIFFGHDARRGLQIDSYSTGLDTGCVYGGYLTACILKCNEIGHVQSEQIHAKEEWEKEAVQTIDTQSGLRIHLVQIKPSRVYNTQK